MRGLVQELELVQEPVPVPELVQEQGLEMEREQARELVLERVLVREQEQALVQVRGQVQALVLAQEQKMGAVEDLELRCCLGRPLPRDPPPPPRCPLLGQSLPAEAAAPRCYH